ncbi:Hypothetical protein FNO222_0427 [Francisella orientalis]|uniref:Uncharacterized protein n=1 Tax=Francisella orientalis TaxID=299583 RepID=A0ABM5U4T2_9GAMM|nr:hypothetical protein [Francisella orientalis]AKN85181.1 hypothetical protein FNO12_0425 [Francisella orientalis FNO12]AKN86719.1 Hypothetical protein FNO24_0425 [Francisella orientalis FNO24]AKN88258.1 Hypothetical protein FNO190_0425 [Francisella orientalis]AKU05012.1 Hypothetical protein FNO01_0425 [Francisella orientalis]QEN19921.1 Hypothetical protein FNO39_0427 [Francisella orientalis]
MLARSIVFESAEAVRFVLHYIDPQELRLSTASNTTDAIKKPFS